MFIHRFVQVAKAKAKVKVRAKARAKAKKVGPITMCLIR
jgi:hypothetical protein